MKKIFRGLAVLVLMLSAALAVSAKTVDMSEYTDGEGWKQFSTALVKDGLMKPGSDRFNTAGLSNSVYYNVLSDAQKASMSRDGFHRLNLAVNNLPEEISSEEFRRVARSLKVPDVRVVAQATPAPAAAPAAQAPVEPTPAGVKSAANGLEERLQKLEGRDDINLTALKTELRALIKAEGEATTKKQYEALAARLDAMNVDVNSRFAAIEGNAKSLAESVVTIGKAAEGTAREVVTVKQTLANQGKAINGLSGQMEEVRGMVGTDPRIWLAILAAVLLAAYAVLRKRGGEVDMKQVKAVAKKEAEDVVGQNTAAFSRRLDNVQSEVSSAKVLAQEAMTEAQSLGAIFPFDGDDFKKAWEMVGIGANVLWTTTYTMVDGQTFGPVTLGFIPVGDKLYIDGVKDLSEGNGVGNDLMKVKRALRRAAASGRVIGLSEASAQAFADNLANPAKDFPATQNDQPDTIPAPLPADPVKALNEALRQPGFGTAKAAPKGQLPLDDEMPAFLRKRGGGSTTVPA